MAGTLATTLKNAMLDAAASGTCALVISYAGLANASGVELTGGTPAYARKAVTFAAGNAGAKAISGTYTFDVPAGGVVAQVNYYAAVSGGSPLATDATITQETYAGQGTYVLTSGTISLPD